MRWKRILLGPELATRDDSRERVGAVTGVPLLGLDALASAAYGPEALLTVLLPLGIAADRHMLPLTFLIVAVLVLVVTSYLQTVGEYPDGGGSFTVAKQNLGEGAGLVAAAALGLDYVLNVAVAVSAGVGALVSAVPALFSHTLLLSLTLVAVITIVNLRGVRTAGRAFMVPTYAFVLCVGGVLVTALFKALLAHGAPAAISPVAGPPPAIAAPTVWLLARAFASGCTAMTGIEAVSNAVPLFEEPRQRAARRTLLTIGALLALLLVGVASACAFYGITATTPGAVGYESVLSRVTRAAAGRGVVYYATMASVMAVLALSANTSFTDFPRLCRLLALDRFLPSPFAHRGRRLVFTFGVLLLAALSTTLLALFGGVTDRLIPLFAVGAFLAFTLSQAGMVAHWRRARGPRASFRLAANLVGAVATGATTAVVLVSKFREGAWISVLVLAVLVAALWVLRRHALRIETATSTDEPLDASAETPPRVIVAVHRWDRAARKALRVGMALSPDVEVVQVLGEDAPTEADLSRRWRDLVEAPSRREKKTPPRLLVIRSEYRELLAPIVRVVCKTTERDAGREVAVVVPELIEPGWYRWIAGRSAAVLLKTLILLEGGPRILVVSVPWYVGAGRARARRGRWRRHP